MCCKTLENGSALIFWEIRQINECIWIHLMLLNGQELNVSKDEAHQLQS